MTAIDEAPLPVGGTASCQISVALLAGLAFMPIVVAAGFLTDRPGRAVVPGDISVMALRGALGNAPAEKLRPSRAGY